MKLKLNAVLTEIEVKTSKKGKDYTVVKLEQGYNYLFMMVKRGSEDKFSISEVEETYVVDYDPRYKNFVLVEKE